MHLPSLRAVAYIPCAKLESGIRDIISADSLVSIYEKPVKIHCLRKASLSTSEESTVPGGTSTLTFQTQEPLPDNEPLAFILYTHTDETLLLIGAWEPPFPVIKQEFTTGATPKDIRAISVTVTWSSLPARAIFV